MTGAFHILKSVRFLCGILIFETELISLKVLVRLRGLEPPCPCEH